jgi:iron complex transport system substrate-binding protein
LRHTRCALICALLAWIGGLGCSAYADAPIILLDSAHHELRFEHPPARIVSLLPSITETICELGECARLVAIDRYSNWPHSVTRLPKAGGLEDFDVEQIVSVRPDVVLLAPAPRVFERLRDLGVVVFEIEAETYADIARNVSTVGTLLGVSERANLLNRRIARSVEEVAAAARTRLGSRAPLVYCEVDPAPYGAGPRSFMGEMLARVGARNILTADLGPFPKLNPEYVVRADPDIIFISAAEAPQLALRPGWEKIRAVRERRICSFASEVRDTIVRPGPRVAQGLTALGECLTRVAP